MDPVCRLQLVRVLIQLDDEQNIVTLKHQHQQVIRQCRLRRQWRWWCRPWLLRWQAFGQFEHLMVEHRIEDPAGFQIFVRCEPAMFQEMVNRLTPRICKLDTNYCTALDPGLKVAIALLCMATSLSGWNLVQMLLHLMHRYSKTMAWKHLLSRVWLLSCLLTTWLMMIEILHTSLLVMMPSLCAPTWWQTGVGGARKNIQLLNEPLPKSLRECLQYPGQQICLY